MNLRQLQYFVEVSDLESVTKAADRLRVAQPALTRHMRKLERELGVQCLRAAGAASC
jgi:DNA-binding transcriptional LysR family regulator